MKSFVKENASLVIALALPILFALFFYIFKDSNQSNVEPPKYDFVIVDNKRSDMYDFSIIDEKLSATFTYQTVRENGRPYNVSQPNLFYVNAETLIAEPISVNIPANANNPPANLQGKRVELDISKFQDKKFNAASISPDGFELTYHRNYRDGNIMTEIFSGHRNNDNGLILAKDGAKFDIRGLNRYYGFEVVGWIVNETE